MSSAEFSGSCICGSVSYEITGEPRAFYHCHCRRCRKASGTGHASNVILNLDTVKWTAGEDLIGKYKVPGAKRFGTVFCTHCGSPLPRIAPDLSYAVIPAGSLDTDPPINPTARIMCDSRVAWSCEDDSLPAWAEYPE
jgi:hypothetical protein